MCGGMDDGMMFFKSSYKFTGVWEATADMAAARAEFPSVLLESGKVLASGGYDMTSGPSLASTEIFDPDTGTSGTWTAGPTMSEARRAHTATRLNDGKVLIAGGVNGFTGSTVTSSAELYTPPVATKTPAPPPATTSPAPESASSGAAGGSGGGRKKKKKCGSLGLEAVLAVALVAALRKTTTRS
jgi:hypothetical protein